MKKQKMSLKELYALAKGKPVNCCETSSATKAAKREVADGQCCATKKDNSCC